jgi:hypothetical protein
MYKSLCIFIRHLESITQALQVILWTNAERYITKRVMSMNVDWMGTLAEVALKKMDGLCEG